ncbi:MAG: acetyl/propionyl/methylcrotonyl-CoA carboxylase subunit alpha [Betaproteobacteria bacterium]|nr:MAG: acetyl/propionyl/methylcrotonyl-CoA carboxylase subunit alpha [Betaproteobacteria bacterium]
MLVANRGEIACRVMRSARRLAMRTVAVYSDADAGALHVRLADEARRIESYLDGEAVLAAARDSGAEAIHPGYGFLSENAMFAAACREAGVVFVGPSPEAIAAMGDKAAAKRLMEKTGVPLVPGYHGEGQDAALLEKEAQRIGFPVLIKPSAGGGGKGMRVVKEKASFGASLEAARREAKSAFGDDRVIVERYLERPRHIEVQVLGDAHGKIVHLFERDCSVQRRHQKVIEEAPAPGFSQKKRNEIGAAAVTAAKAIGYRGAGTVEFIAGEDGRFYFMEMNTRLQVEHPVTEMITGLDLVELQLRVAAGEALPFSQEDLGFSGHAIEARIYAEDPERDFLPSTGRLVHVAFPLENADVRVDHGVQAGDAITPWYDPMIAKLIVRGENRAAALARLRRALDEVEIAGVTTNVAFLRRIAASHPFGEAELDTGFVERHRGQLLRDNGAVPVEILAAAAFAELAEEERIARERAMRSGDPFSPWHRVDGWRLNKDSHHDFLFMERGAEHPVRVRFTEQALRIAVQEREHALAGERRADGILQLRLDGRVFSARAVRDGADWHVFCEGGYRRLGLKEALPAVDAETHGGSLAAPMPGRIVRVLAKAGVAVKKGEPLIILEAMKMEHTITAPADGVIKEIHYAAGEQVLEGAELITLE